MLNGWSHTCKKMESEYLFNNIVQAKDFPEPQSPYTPPRSPDEIFCSINVNDYLTSVDLQEDISLSLDLSETYPLDLDTWPPINDVNYAKLTDDYFNYNYTTPELNLNIKPELEEHTLPLSRPEYPPNIKPDPFYNTPFLKPQDHNNTTNKSVMWAPSHHTRVPPVQVISMAPQPDLFSVEEENDYNFNYDTSDSESSTSSSSSSSSSIYYVRNRVKRAKVHYKQQQGAKDPLGDHSYFHPNVAPAFKCEPLTPSDSENEIDVVTVPRNQKHMEIQEQMTLFNLKAKERLQPLQQSARGRRNPRDAPAMNTSASTRRPRRQTSTTVQNNSRAAQTQRGSTATKKNARAPTKYQQAKRRGRKAATQPVIWHNDDTSDDDEDNEYQNRICNNKRVTLKQGMGRGKGTAVTLPTVCKPKASTSGCIKRREHNDLEKNRRITQKKLLMDLKNSVYLGDNTCKVSKVAVLIAARKCAEDLTKQREHMTAEIYRLNTIIANRKRRLNQLLRQKR